MRVFPAAATGTFRVTEKPMELGGYWLPTGTNIAVPIYGLHMLPAHFPQPEKFLPQRWLSSAPPGAVLYQPPATGALPSAACFQSSVTASHCLKTSFPWQCLILCPSRQGFVVIELLSH